MLENVQGVLDQPELVHRTLRQGRRRILPPRKDSILSVILHVQPESGCLLVGGCDQSLDTTSTRAEAPAQ